MLVAGLRGELVHANPPVRCSTDGSGRVLQPGIQTCCCYNLLTASAAANARPKRHCASVSEHLFSNLLRVCASAALCSAMSCADEDFRADSQIERRQLRLRFFLLRLTPVVMPVDGGFLLQFVQTR